jgi:dGTPase
VEIRRVLGETKAQMITTLVSSIIRCSMNNNFIKMEDEIYDKMVQLRNWMFSNVYGSPEMIQQRAEIATIINTLCDMFEKNPEKMTSISTPDDIQRSVCDYVASMTDNYALKTYRDAI